MLRVLVVVILLVPLPEHARAEARIALLIGNQAYNPTVGPFKNPHDDIALVGAALRSLGSTVTEVTDADYRSMDAGRGWDDDRAADQPSRSRAKPGARIMITWSAVIVNGEIVWDHGSATGRRPGHVLARDPALAIGS